MKAKIYRIILPCGGTYVGQTLRHEYQRWGAHLNDLTRNAHDNEQMQASYNNGELDDWKFEVIETIETDDKAYANLMEQHYIELENNSINRKKKRVNNKAKLKSYSKKANTPPKPRRKWRDISEEQKKANRKEWMENNKEKIRGYYKKYYEKNREKKIEYSKKYNKQNFRINCFKKQKYYRNRTR